MVMRPGYIILNIGESVQIEYMPQKRNAPVYCQTNRAIKKVLRVNYFIIKGPVLQIPVRKVGNYYSFNLQKRCIEESENNLNKPPPENMLKTPSTPA